MHSFAGVVVVVVALAAAGCSTTTGTPVAGTSDAVTSERITTPPTTPSGPPVGQAVMRVDGSGPATIRYQINGGPQQTETGVTLPWEKSYPVFDQVESTVSADAGDTSLICTITMDGDKLVSFVSQPRPVCSFAYWG